MHIDDLANQSGVPHRKARIVMVLLKRHGLVREHRGGRWERLRNNLVACDLSADLMDYEERRARDQAKLRSIIAFCQTAQLPHALHPRVLRRGRSRRTGNAATATRVTRWHDGQPGDSQLWLRTVVLGHFSRLLVVTPSGCLSTRDEHPEGFTSSDQFKQLALLLLGSGSSRVHWKSASLRIDSDSLPAVFYAPRAAWRPRRSGA